MPESALWCIYDTEAMPTHVEIITALSGKAIERGLRPEPKGEGALSIHYPEPVSKGEDHLHKQSIRSLVKRIAPDWKVTVDKIGATPDEYAGFVVQVWPPATATTTSSSTPDERLEAVAERLERLVDRLEAQVHRDGNGS